MRDADIIKTRWTYYDVQDLKRLWTDGQGDAEIARRLHRTARGVSTKRYKLGLVRQRMVHHPRIQSASDAEIIAEALRRGFTVGPIPATRSTDPDTSGPS